MRKKSNANRRAYTKKTNEIAELRRLVADSIKSTEEYKRSTEEYKKSTEEYKKKFEEYTRRVEEYSRRIEQYIQNSQKDWAKFKKELGNISNRMGTLIEDFIIPNIPSICKTLIGFEPDMIPARIERKKNGDFIEYDTISLVKTLLL
ncbi:MAG: hypothetical protein NZ927_08010 [Candidatus Calescibacterium sp.]|nr:hypothetical protein [Candidatus Calescibacterium sp.]MCX7733167.1 hypothetical protein [bacterium]MDW8087822.1 hypothetical protein [Candidatus Calescibacterium sp.]